MCVGMCIYILVHVPFIPNHKQSDNGFWSCKKLHKKSFKNRHLCLNLVVSLLTYSCHL